MGPALVSGACGELPMWVMGVTWGVVMVSS
jgi:hypothetical protein